MQMNTLSSQKTLRLTLYSGIALIVVSMLFLGRDAQTSPAVIKIGLAVATPALFYGVGGLVYKHLNAPLAAPGIVATGAWLIAVELIHFYDQRDVLPAFARDYYWLGAALFAAVVITLTGHRARIWLLIPLVPLTQINAIAAIMSATGLSVAWWPVFAFLLVLAWWEWPLDDEWKLVYRVSAVLFEVFLLIFSYWLPAQTANSMLITWATCALLVTVLGVRHGWVNLGPLALVLLSLAVVWGLPATWWPPLWLVIAIGTVMFIERLARGDTGTNSLAVEMSTALAVLLSGVAALIAVMLPYVGVAPVPVLTIFTLISSGGLMIWIGKRYELVTAEHAGLWMLAAGWAELYFLGRSDTALYGLWLSLLAVAALLIERLLISAKRQKHKTLSSIQHAVVRWPLADLVIGLSVIIVIWAGFAALDLPDTDPVIVTITVSIAVGVWLTAGLLYRLPALLHVALWLAPFPYALLLILTVPPLRTLPMLGMAWQVLAATYLLIGHALPRHRPAMLAPFFVAGYILLGFGLTLTVGNELLLVVSLGWMIVVTFVTSIAVISGAHPAWTVFVARLIPPEQRGYAFKHVHNAFVFLTAWLSVIWLYLMLGIAQFPTPHQGIILVLFSSAWIMLGRLLPRLPGMVGWPVYAAGWFMWLIGLLQVFFAPSEAIITAIFGLALSAEALHRSKAIQWMPVFILQILFCVLQIAWMLQISGFSFLLAVTLCISAAGMWYDHQRRDPAGRITAITGAILSVVLWFVRVDPITTSGMMILVVVALVVYRRWELLAAIYGPVVIMAMLFGIASDWRALIVLGGAQLLTGALIVTHIRPRVFRTISRLLIGEMDWATPFLWGGLLSASAGLLLGWQQADSARQLTFYTIDLAATITLTTVLLRVPRLPYVPLCLLGSVLILLATGIGNMAYHEVGDTLAAFDTRIALVALAFQLPSLGAVRKPRPFARMRWLVWWIKPLQYASGFLTIISVSVLLVSQAYIAKPIWFIIPGLLISAIFVITFLKTHRLGWVWFALGMAWLVWAQFLTALELGRLQWHTIPVGIALLALARTVKKDSPRTTELLAIATLMLGSAMDVDRHGIVSPAAILLALQLVALAVYGYMDQRAVPFFGAAVVIVGGVAYLIVMINLWLIPFVTGSLLLAGTVLLETRRNEIDQWVAFWRTRLAI